MIKLLALDLDGTLLDGNRKIPEQTKARLIDLRKQGISIILATGRTFESAKRYYYELGLDTPFIGCNGGVIYQPDQDRIIKGAAFSKEDFIDVIEKLSALGVFYQYYGLHCIYAKRLAFGVKRWKCENIDLPKEWQMQIRLVEDPLLWAREEYHPVYKILARSSSQEKLDEVADVIEQMEGIDTVSSFALGLDIGPADCDKGKALEVVGKALGMRPEEILAMGDNDNDREMIRFAGLGIAMGNATKAAKEAADYCMNVNDGPGVLQALDRFL
ncbi:Cof-type HAD-IIB family hydrolase [Gottschalkiaceae bacterium SANA]|nr:Cof-type HAD-IIB family hydrolase [Gottschalkiaceae bacterium SANA]